MFWSCHCVCHHVCQYLTRVLKVIVLLYFNRVQVFNKNNVSSTFVHGIIHGHQPSPRHLLRVHLGNSQHTRESDSKSLAKFCWGPSITGYFADHCPGLRGEGGGRSWWSPHGSFGIFLHHCHQNTLEPINIKRLNNDCVEFIFLKIQVVDDSLQNDSLVSNLPRANDVMYPLQLGGRRVRLDVTELRAL